MSRLESMADIEPIVLEHYQLPTAYPIEWPAVKDLSDASSDEEFVVNSKRTGVVRRSKSRYSALERSASDRRSLVPGSQKTGDGVENLVQKDEPDPLGTSDSVVWTLREQGLPVQDDTNLRKYSKFHDFHR
jgi:exocyst complex component 2